MWNWRGRSTNVTLLAQRRKIKSDEALPCNHCRRSCLSRSQLRRNRRAPADNNGLEHRNTEFRDRLDRLESPSARVAAAYRYVAGGFRTSLAGEVQALREVP